MISSKESLLVKSQKSKNMSKKKGGWSLLRTSTKTQSS